MVRKTWFIGIGALLAAIVAPGCGGDDDASSGTSGPGTTSSTTTTGSGGSGGEGTGGNGSGGGTGGGGEGAGLPTGLEAAITDKRFYVADHMIASIEMQISGEPFAEILGRDIGGYDRFSADTNVYLNPETGQPETDTLGWALAIESYEYSKQAMNNTSFEAGAGLSLQFGPSVNPALVEGEPAFQLLFDRIQYFGLASRATGNPVCVGCGKDFVTSPPDQTYANNFYGWPALWPVFAEFRSFDPTIPAAAGATEGCNLAGAIDEPIPPELLPPDVADYECDYNSLNLLDREAQVDKVIEPSAMGYAAWKQLLWAINYWAAMHDVGGNAIEVVEEGDLAEVGIPGNQVIGQFPSPIDPSDYIFGKDGTYLGGVSLEGFQGLVMLEEVHNKAQFLIGSLTTTDGTAFDGFSGVAEALDYDYETKLRWWPASVGVTEKVTAGSPAEDRKLFPKPETFTIDASKSRLEDLSGVLGGFATYYAVTDYGNPELGGTQMFRATFDGDPWAGDDQFANGDETPHDLALGVIKVALVNLYRLHFDEANQVLVNESQPSDAGVTKGTKVDTFRAGNLILALRQTLRALNSSLSLYGNDTPDQLGAPTPLDTTKLQGAPFGGTLEAHIVDLVKAEADFIAEKILDQNGLAANGYDLAAGTPDASPTTLEAQSAAVRALLEAYLVTSDDKYRQSAILAYAALEKEFWMSDVRAYRSVTGESSTMEYTPANFGALEGALRQYFKLVASAPGKEEEAAAVLARVERSMKLVMNGWNDANKDGKVDDGECLGGRLQMAERALTGELSVPADGGDRDKDCVPDIATAGLPAALAGKVVFTRK
jgi:hypothetical protein